MRPRIAHMTGYLMDARNEENAFKCFLVLLNDIAKQDLRVFNVIYVKVLSIRRFTTPGRLKVYFVDVTKFSRIHLIKKHRI